MTLCLCYMPGTVLGSFEGLAQGIPQFSLWGRDYYHSQFTQRKQAQKS